MLKNSVFCNEFTNKLLVNLTNKKLILTGDVGLSVSSKLTAEYEYFENYSDVYDLAIKDNKNLLFIYRSDYRKISQR